VQQWSATVTHFWRFTLWAIFIYKSNSERIIKMVYFCWIYCKWHYFV